MPQSTFLQNLIYSPSVLKSPFCRMTTQGSLKLKYGKALIEDTAEFLSRIPFLKSGENNIKKAISSSLKNVNLYLGSGHEGSVYRIGNTKFSVKVKKGANLEKSLKMPYTADLSEQEKVNHVVGKIGEDIKIMHFIRGSEIKGQFCVEDFTTSQIKICLSHISDAARKGMRHDCGGRNILFDKVSGSLTPIDFFQNSPGMKHSLINDLFLQTYNCAKTPHEANKLLGNISLSFLELLKTGEIRKRDIKYMSADLKTVKDILRTDPNIRNGADFAIKLEEKLNRIMSLKSMEGISPEITKELSEKIHETENFVKSI